MFISHEMGTNLPLEFRTFANLASDRALIHSSTRSQVYPMTQTRRTTARRCIENSYGRINIESLRSRLSSFTPRSTKQSDSFSGDQESRKETTEESEATPEGPIVVCDDLDALLKVCVD